MCISGAQLSLLLSFIFKCVRSQKSKLTNQALVVQQSVLHTDDGQCHCRHKCSDLIQTGQLPSQPREFLKHWSLASVCTVTFVLGGKPKGLQKIKVVVVNAEDLKKMKQMTRAERMAVAT
jgi:hypothetical protein